jgi:hypothetical protein
MAMSPARGNARGSVDDLREAVELYLDEVEQPTIEATPELDKG